MASTITRTTWTDDTGTPASPVGDGTTINNARLQEIYAAIDELFAGASPYDPLVFGGTIQVDGLGTHLFSATGAGANRLRVRAASAGTSNVGAVDVGTDADADLGRLEAYASTFTAAGAAKQHGVALRGMGAGGVSLAAEHASGDVRLYARGTTKVATYDGNTLSLASAAAGAYAASGVLDASVNTTAASTGANTTETDLHTVSLPANTLAANGQAILFQAAVTTADNTNTKTVRLYFGSTQLFSVGSANRAGAHLFSAWIVRTGPSSQVALAGIPMSGQTSGQFAPQAAYTTPAETLSGAVTVKITGLNGTATAGEITCEFSLVRFLP